MMKLQHFGIVTLCLVSLSAQSETTVISGDFLNDLRRAPVVGGGFSLTTQDYKSVCFETIEVSKPSYDLYYDFQSVETNWREQFYRQRQPDSSQARLTYWFLDHFGGEQEQKSVEKGKSLRILARVQLKSYYAALNESHSQLSEPARVLLENRDITGFFDACGTYYIRTISRYSSLYALFTLTEKKSTLKKSTLKDFQFHLERLFQGIEMPSDSRSIKLKNESERYFENKSLHIRLAGFGLGKEQMVSLAPTDLDSFKKVLQNSTQAMAGIHTGRVEAIEIIPWMDNLNFHYALQPVLEEQRETTQNPLASDKKSEQYRFWRKWVVAENSEFIALVKNHYRELQEQYFMALNCQAQVNRHIAREKAWAQSLNDKEFSWEQITFRNHQAKLTIRASQLSQQLMSLTGREIPWKIEDVMPTKSSTTLYQQWQEFTQRADECLAVLEPEMTTSSYREVSYCADLIKNMVQIMPQALFDYCPPEVTDEHNNP
ncbi:hypothetical protein [Candidatus Parabeggiatoa sp. HSG14]|uniref:hypothetical protein n=1 Tax=Candidatus Parabeggiatoa sp. HSG14 TaxID=3055593 RepID=UPI0025A798ED|nr:hypothetical protein [Thiotrichales bacterium HSG14]